MALSAARSSVPTVPETLRDASGKEVKILIRTADCFVNVTEVCRSYGKDWKEFHRLPRTKQYVARLSTVVGKSHLELIQSQVGGNSQIQGTWADRRIAVRCLAWCNPNFEIAADELAGEYIMSKYRQ